MITVYFRPLRALRDETRQSWWTGSDKIPAPASVHAVLASIHDADDALREAEAGGFPTVYLYVADPDAQAETLAAYQGAAGVRMVLPLTLVSDSEAAA